MIILDAKRRRKLVFMLLYSFFFFLFVAVCTCVSPPSDVYLRVDLIHIFLWVIFRTLLRTNITQTVGNIAFMQPECLKPSVNVAAEHQSR